MLTKLYRKLIPYSVRLYIYDIVLGKILFFFRHFGIISKSRAAFLFQIILPKTEKNSALAFMGRYGLTSYPYPYMFEYKRKEIQVSRDKNLNLPYVLHNDKKLYFPQFYTDEKVVKDYRALITEQDSRSSHRYVRSYNELKGLTLMDIGSAEGIFALDTIDLVSQVYIFECEEFWLKPLKATFEPWKEKVRFIKKYVGHKTDDIYITIDDLLNDLPKENLFLKMDIEGAERNALEGAQNLMKFGRNIHLAVCTYHRPDDPEYLQNLLINYGFSTEFSDGLMYWNKRFSKGLVRAVK